MSDKEDAPRGGSGGWRRPSVVLAVLAVSFAVLTYLQPGERAPPQKQEGRAEADAALVHEFSGVATPGDGDTLRIGERRVRLDGILAPERVVRCGDLNVFRASIDALREVTRSQQVVCRISDQPDDEGRDLAQCRAGDIDLGAHMVAQGWARDWPLHSGGAYADEEAAARAAQRGVWSASCPADMWRGTALDD